MICHFLLKQVNVEQKLLGSKTNVELIIICVEIVNYL